MAAYHEDNEYASGGGFSNYFKRPSYQDLVVPAYISSLKHRFDGLYNSYGRGYPDISAQSQSVNVVWNGVIGQLDGTSASTPTVAGILTLVNDALLAAGKPVLGFLNPCLYTSLHKAFTDITNGSAAGCDSEGFPAQAGWDAVTGFGTPVRLLSFEMKCVSNSVCSTFLVSKTQCFTRGQAYGPEWYLSASLVSRYFRYQACYARICGDFKQRQQASSR